MFVLVLHFVVLKVMLSLYYNTVEQNVCAREITKLMNITSSEGFGCIIPGFQSMVESMGFETAIHELFTKCH